MNITKFKNDINIINVEFKDRLDRTFTIDARINEPVAMLLNRNHIPIDAVIVKRNGIVIDDWQERIEAGYTYSIEMVRAYHLPDFLSLLRLWNTNAYQGKIKTREDSYYTKRMFLHNDTDGDYTATQTSFNKEEFVSYLEETFVEGILLNNLIEDQENIGLAMSGGRDSLSLGYFLSRTKTKLPEFQIKSIHVGAFSKPAETRFAREIAEKFNFNFRLVTDDEVIELFNLKKTPHEVLDFIKHDFNKSYSIGATHIIMRAAVENAAKEQGIKKLAYGLMTEDIMSSIIKGIFVGMPFKGPFKNQMGNFELVYPLWPISKKELTLYLDAIVPHHNTQGSPSEFERGALSRDVYYLITDTLENILPGLGMQLFQAQKSTNTFLTPYTYHECQNCGVTYSSSYKPEIVSSQLKEYKENNPGLCDLCNIFDEHNLITT
ncbi:hypothetical protein MXL46_17960 [Heyndrickxia sporothermodurans]|uniref:Uncharacterized protein n=1 Tax=Heyndrickxia vini TaxID=1476025 RepID=A0ABX7E379_9BACI|nr:MULTISPECIES: hypothetical protein [Heyndrickxia]MEB6550946.1 hypothetical protein [Heyndrickxia sporothermodurans]QQZ09740.1 hypothetical protein I5776_01800 [Heyndrickxia vini]